MYEKMKYLTNVIYINFRQLMNQLKKANCFAALIISFRLCVYIIDICKMNMQIECFVITLVIDKENSPYNETGDKYVYDDF